jgi:hypothetical protein
VPKKRRTAAEEEEAGEEQVEAKKEEEEEDSENGQQQWAVLSARQWKFLSSFSSYTSSPSEGGAAQRCGPCHLH